MGAARRDLDPLTGDYVVVRGSPRADSTRASKVILRLRKKRGTGIYPQIGSRLYRITKNAPGALRLAEFYATEAVEDLVRSGEIRSVVAKASTEVIRSTTWLVLELSFSDTDGDRRTVRYLRTFGG